MLKMFQWGSVSDILNFVIFDMTPQEMTPKTDTTVHRRAVVAMNPLLAVGCVRIVILLGHNIFSTNPLLRQPGDH